MAQKIITTVELTDDLDGTKADQTVTFGWDGVSYQIDLSKKNARIFDRLIAPYVAAARRERTSARRSRAAGSRSGSSSGRRTDLADIRAWAQQAGYQVSDRGRIPNPVIEAYDAR